jgi:NAD(P)H dehydrogenase (quinone)
VSLTPFVLVTGATGATGRATVSELLARGAKVRALVHKADVRSERLASLGAEIVEGDLLDFMSVRAALDGVRRAYFVFPIIPGIIQATAYFAQGASEVGLEAIVNMSQISARREAKSNAARDHWIAERVFDRSGIAVTHLRPTFFAEWLLYFAPSVVRDGSVKLPFSGRHAPISAEDQARVISSILLDPGPHRNHIYSLYGSEELSYAEMAQVMSQVLNRQIRYEQIDFDTFEKALTAMGRGPFLAQHLREVAVDHHHGLFAGKNDLVEQLTGRKPLSLREFLLKNKQAFASA